MPRIRWTLRRNTMLVSSLARRHKAQVLLLGETALGLAQQQPEKGGRQTPWGYENYKGLSPFKSPCTR